MDRAAPSCALNGLVHHGALTIFICAWVHLFWCLNKSCLTWTSNKDQGLISLYSPSLLSEANNKRKHSSAPVDMTHVKADLKQLSLEQQRA